MLLTDPFIFTNVTQTHFAIFISYQEYAVAVKRCGFKFWQHPMPNQCPLLISPQKQQAIQNWVFLSLDSSQNPSVGTQPQKSFPLISHQRNPMVLSNSLPHYKSVKLSLSDHRLGGGGLWLVRFCTFSKQLLDIYYVECTGILWRTNESK